MTRTTLTTLTALGALALTAFLAAPADAAARRPGRAPQVEAPRPQPQARSTAPRREAPAAVRPGRNTQPVRRAPAAAPARRIPAAQSVGRHFPGPRGHWEIRTERVLVREGYWTTVVEPAAYETRRGDGHGGSLIERILRALIRTREVRRVWVPAEYETRTVRVWVGH